MHVSLIDDYPITAIGRDWHGTGTCIKLSQKMHLLKDIILYSHETLLGFKLDTAYENNSA